MSAAVTDLVDDDPDVWRMLASHLCSAVKKVAAFGSGDEMLAPAIFDRSPSILKDAILVLADLVAQRTGQISSEACRG